MMPSDRLMELRRRQVDRLQRRVEVLERENDKLRIANHALLDIVYGVGTNWLLERDKLKAMIVHRLDRGPFSGIIRLNEHGPWRGWYGYSWTAGGVGGGQQGLGKAHAYHELYEAMLKYFAKQQAPLK